MPAPWRTPAALLLLGLAVPALAAAHDASGGSGGAAVPAVPEVTRAVCEDATAWACSRGARLTLIGDALRDVRQVRFVGGPSAGDDRTARPRRAAAHRLDVLVPRSARSGRIAVTAPTGRRDVTARRLRVRAAAATAAPPVVRAEPSAPGAAAEPATAFPIAGRHRYGDGFGGARGHGGQDVFARCGTPLVAFRDAQVRFTGFQARAGNYLVLRAPGGASFAYMHLQAPPEVRRGDAVSAGDRVGRVGATGRASGCHLHFEQWTAPGWYEGGRPVDPLPLLRRLDR